MQVAELQELLDLKGWSRVRLAAELDITENAVQRWFMNKKAPHGPASILLRMWLDEARAANGHQGKRNGKVAKAS